MSVILYFLKTFILKIQKWAKPKEEGGKRGIVKSFVNYFVDLALAALALIEMLPIFLVFAKVFIVTIIAAVLLLIVLSVYMMIMSFFGVVNEDTLPEIPSVESPSEVVGSGGKQGSKLAWSIEEFNANLTNLTDFEQNLYKLSILINQGVDGYGTGEVLFKTPSNMIELDIAMFLGKLSIENGMKLYPDGKYYDVFTVPSRTGLNSEGYGLYGLSKHASLEGYDSKGTLTAALKAAYPAPAVTLDYPAQFYPWATFMALAHMQTKVSVVDGGIKSGGARDWATADTLVNEIMDEWGFEHNREELHTLIFYFLLQAQYHGAELVEYPEYINFWCALHFLSHPEDSKRSLSNWSVKDVLGESTGSIDYTESTFRTSFIGSGGMNAPMRMDHTALTLGNQRIRFIVNNTTLTVPVWKYVLSPENMSSYPESRRSALNEAWSLAKEFSRLQFENKGRGKGTRILNFHYGLNSYLRGKEFVSLLESKVVPLRSTLNFGMHNPDGNAIVTYKGQKYSTTAFVEAHGDTLLFSKESGKRIISTFQKYYGLSFYASGFGLKGGVRTEMQEEAEKQRSLYPLSGDAYGIPFHLQGSNSSREEYGPIPWSATISRNTFNRNGCMIYANAYMLTAKTGFAINPPEAATLMMMTDSLRGEGMYSTNLGDLYDLFGLESERVENVVNNWAKVDKAVEEGAVVLLKFHNPPIASSGIDHFVVLTKRVVGSDGVVRYRMYSSSRISDSLKLWKREELVGLRDYAHIVY